MSIGPILPGETFTAVLEDAPSGLTGLSFAVRTTPARVAVAVTGSGVSEATAEDDSTYYEAERTLPSPLDPTDPAAGTGYEVVWDHASLAEPITEPLIVGFVPTFSGDWVPTPDDVAAFARARLRAEGGAILTGFTDTSAVTETQVSRLIDLMTPLVLMELGDLSDDTLVCSEAQRGVVRASARTLLAMVVAREIELSFWPEEVVNSSRSAEEYWGDLIDTLLPKVVQAARECALGDVVAGDESAVLEPAWNFPGVGSVVTQVNEDGTGTQYVERPLTTRRW